MLVTLAYCLRDHDITLQLINWMKELGDYKPRHTLLLCHDHRCPKNTVQAILDASRPLFTDVRDIEAKANIDGWPEGANYMFRTVASYLANNATNVKHFLWLEPDAIPLKIGWLDDLETEYLVAKKPFMGDDVQVENIPRHMSGVGVYPNPIYDFAGEANRASDVAWDMSAAEQIVPQAHFTKLINHAWKHETFTNPHELTTQMRPEAVIFHSSKDGSLIKLLRDEKQRKNSQGWHAPVHTDIHTIGGPYPATTENERLQKGMALQASGGSKGNVSSGASETQRQSQNTGTGQGTDSGLSWEDYQAWRMQQLREAHNTEAASRTPPRLQPADEGSVAMRDMPPTDPQNLKLLGEQQRSAAHAVPTGSPQDFVHVSAGLTVSNEGENPSPLPHQLPGSFQHHDEMYAHSVRGSGPIDAWVTRKIGEGNKHSDPYITTHDRPTTKDRDKPRSPSPSPIYDIFIRTYPVDYPWLQFCLRSINQYATGFRKIWIVSPEGVPFIQTVPVKIERKVMNEESEDGYLSQQIHKLYADTITGYEADYILHIDSDTLFTRPVTPGDFFSVPSVPGTPELIWYYTPYEHTETPWKVITQKFLGEDPPFEFMRRLPMMIPSWLYPELRTFCFEKHKKNLGDYVRAQPYREFSEFNALGAYAWKFHHDKFHWVNTMEGEMPPPFARQFFSWGGLTEEVKVEIQNILSGVPVLAESKVPATDEGGEARESCGVAIVPDRTESRGTGQSPSGVVDKENTVGSESATPSPFNGSDDETPGDHVRWLERYIEGNHSRRQYVMGQLKKARLVPLKRGKVKQK